MSHQEVTAAIDRMGMISNSSEGGNAATYLRAKDLEQMSHEKGFSLVSVVLH